MALCVGLITAQLIACIHIGLSNIRFYNKLKAISDAGYLPVPNLQTAELLKSFETAFFGGIFFTLSVGLFISLSSLAGTWIWLRHPSRRKPLLFIMMLGWLGCIIFINAQGISVMATAYFIFIPPAVFFSLLKWPPGSASPNSWRPAFLHLTCVIIIALAGAGRVNAAAFSMIRDHFLLSNPVGVAINNFYYRYTLYPAQVFKNMDQDQIRICRITANSDGSQIPRLKNILLSYDYCPIPDSSGPVDLDIVQINENLSFQHRGEEVFQIPFEEFWKNTGKTLKQFSRQTDRYLPFRQFTFISLITVCGAGAYFILWGAFFLLFRIFLKSPPATVLAMIFCIAAGLSAFSHWPSGVPKLPKDQTLKTALASEDPAIRVTALKMIYFHGRELADFKSFPSMARSGYVLERYWLARSLTHSRSPATYAVHLSLLDDPQINVAYMAFQSMAGRGEKQAVSEILKRINTSNQWYVQWYAYRTLRKLGWNQTASN